MTAHKAGRIFFNVLILLFISQLPFFTTHAQETITFDPISPDTKPDLLIILSPQYEKDEDICTAISLYSTTVYNDLGYNTTLIPLQEQHNNYQDIDRIIENAYQHHPVKACLMVGEDLNTALSGDCDYLEQPSIVPWSTLGGPSSYEYTDQGVTCKPTTQQICISLLYPIHDLPYEQKKASLLFAFSKFTTQRHTSRPSTIRVFESSDLNTNSKALYQRLNTYGMVLYTEDAPSSLINKSLTETYSAYFVHGHSNPGGTDVNTQKNNGWFPAENLNNLQTPVFGADGCYVAGWWSNQQDNDHLDDSIDAPTYSSTIFTSTSLQVIALGLLSQNGFTTPVSFIENVMPELLTGKTLAEAIIGDTCIGDTIIVGDPTFHYTI